MKYLTNSSRIKTQSIFFSKQRWHSERYQWGFTVWKRRAYFKRAHSTVDNWTVWQKKTRENRPEVLHIFYQCSGNITASSITSEEGFFFFFVHSWNNNIFSIFEENILFLNRSEWEPEEMQLKNVASTDRKNNRENQLVTPPHLFFMYYGVQETVVRKGL